MKKLPRKIVVPPPKRRGVMPPMEKTLPDPRKVESKKHCKKPIKPEELEEP